MKQTDIDEKPHVQSDDDVSATFFQPLTHRLELHRDVDKAYQVLWPHHCNFLNLLRVGTLSPRPPNWWAACQKLTLQQVLHLSWWLQSRQPKKSILALHRHNGFLQRNLEACLPLSLWARHLLFRRKRAAGKASCPTKDRRLNKYNQQVRGKGFFSKVLLFWNNSPCLSHDVA